MAKREWIGGRQNLLGTRIDRIVPRERRYLLLGEFLDRDTDLFRVAEIGLLDVDAAHDVGICAKASRAGCCFLLGQNDSLHQLLLLTDLLLRHVVGNRRLPFEKVECRPLS